MKTKKILALALAAVLLVAVSVAGTVAYLTATAGDVVNTFVTSDINIDIWEHEYVGTDTLGTKEVKTNTTYKLVPGDTLPKDPFVRVLKGSEPCYIFVKVTATNTTGVVEYAVDTSKWEQVETGVYMYKEVVPANANADQDFYVLTNNQIKIADALTDETMNPENGTFASPELKFTAYAVQAENLGDNDTAAEIWALAQQ